MALNWRSILCICIYLLSVALIIAVGVVLVVFEGPVAFGIFWGGGGGVIILCWCVLPLLYSAVKNRRSNSEEPYPDVEGADPNVPIPSPESAQSRQSGNASSIPTFPPIHLSTFHVSRSERSALIPSQTSSPITPPGLPLTQTSPTGGAMSEGPGAEPAHLVQQPGSDAGAMSKGPRADPALVQQPGSDAVGFLQYEDSVSIRVPPTAYIAV